MFRKIYIILRDFSRKMGKQNTSAFAASTAFFLFLSLVPMLIMICTLIPFTPLTEENLVTAITDLTPDMIDVLVKSVISDVYDKSAGSILSIAAVATLWSAGKGVLALIRGLNAVNGVVEERNYFLVRIVASFYTIVMLLVVILSLFIMVFGNLFVNMLAVQVPQVQTVFSFLMNFRFLAVWLVLTILFTAVYAYVPNKKLKFREQIPGAAFSAVVWSVFSWGFSIYVERTGAFSTYGSLSIIVIAMLWLYFCMYIIMIGAQLNKYFRPVNQVFFKSRKEKINKT